MEQPLGFIGQVPKTLLGKGFATHHWGTTGQELLILAFPRRSDACSLGNSSKALNETFASAKYQECFPSWQS